MPDRNRVHSRECGCAGGDIMLRDAVLVVVLTIFPLTAVADVIHVPDDLDDVALALFFSMPFDTVTVAPGTYPLNVVWPATPGIVLVSTGGPEVTILDGGDNGQVIGFYTSDADTTTIVSGFTIRRGRADGH
jgi:hypothetical protein